MRHLTGFPGSSAGQESTSNAGDLGSVRGWGRSPWRREWHPTPVFLPGESRGQRSLVRYSPWGHKESDTTERLHFHVSLSRMGEGNGNPLQCSCLENPVDRGAWWAAIYGVAQSRTRLKWLSSSSPLWACLVALSWERIRLQCERPGFDPWAGKIPWRRERLLTPVFWPGEFHGLYSPWGLEESETTERRSLFQLWNVMGIWWIHGNCG